MPESTFPTISVIVPVYQGAGSIARCLESLAGLDYPSARREILVVDDGSTDGSGDLAAAHGATVIRIVHAGRAAALNRGLAAATGELVLFTDADCAVPTDWARRMVGFLMNDPGLAGVGGNLLPGRITAIEVAKLLPYLHEFEEDFVLTGAYTRFCLNGNNMALRRAALVAVGGFSERYLHGADADLTRRLLAAGYRLLRTRASVVTHLKQDSLFAHLRTAFLRGSTVRFAMEEGNFHAQDLLRALLRLPIRLLEDLWALRRLRVLRRPVPLRAHLLALPVTLAGGIVHWCGLVWYFLRYRADLSDARPR